MKFEVSWNPYSAEKLPEFLEENPAVSRKVIEKGLQAQEHVKQHVKRVNLLVVRVR